jgi:DNA-binding transcriptional MocR family regulator
VSKTPLELFIREDISPISKIIYLYLESYYYKNGKSYPRQATIARDLKVSRRTVIRALNELRELGYVKSKRLSSSCAYFPVYDVSKSVYINKESISKYIDISKKDISRPINGLGRDGLSEVSKTISHLGKNLNVHYRTKVHKIKHGQALRKSDQEKIDRFFNSFDKYDRQTVMQKLIDGEIEWPKNLPRLL